MKKILSILMLAMAFGFACTSCSDDSSADDIHFTAPAEKEAAGSYTGTLTRTLSGEMTEASAVFTIEATETPHLARLVLSSPDLSVETSVAVNIAHANDRIVFYNNSETNTIGAPIKGVIDVKKQLTVDFQMKQRSGRGTKTFNFSFTGAKQ